jgi:hypothetical protein
MKFRPFEKITFFGLDPLILGEKTVPAPTVEPTYAACGTTKKQPRTSNGGENKEIPSCP